MNKRLTELHPEARNGNIALTGEVDVDACGGRFTLALAFGRDSAEAGLNARAALLHSFDEAAAMFGKGGKPSNASATRSRRTRKVRPTSIARASPC